MCSFSGFIEALLCARLWECKDEQTPELRGPLKVEAERVIKPTNSETGYVVGYGYKRGTAGNQK